MHDTSEQARAERRARHEAVRAEAADEEAEAIAAEIAEEAAGLGVPPHLRIDRDLDAEL
jgi:hypothetical protein